MCSTPTARSFTCTRRGRRRQSIRATPRECTLDRSGSSSTEPSPLTLSPTRTHCGGSACSRHACKTLHYCGTSPVVNVHYLWRCQPTSTLVNTDCTLVWTQTTYVHTAVLEANHLCACCRNTREYFCYPSICVCHRADEVLHSSVCITTPPMFQNASRSAAQPARGSAFCLVSLATCAGKADITMAERRAANKLRCGSTFPMGSGCPTSLFRLRLEVAWVVRSDGRKGFFFEKG